MSLPDVVSRDEWLAARMELLTQEKQLTRSRDALCTRRRELPMVEIDKPYVFEGPDGEVGLLDLFEGRRQLIVYHFMFDPDWTDGCPACTAGMNQVSDALLSHLRARETAFAAVGRARYATIADYQARQGWTFAFYSSYGSDFNYDFDVTIDEAVKPQQYNYRAMPGAEPFEEHGHSCFLRDGDRVFHTYSTYARGSESLGGSYYWLDLTALGRQEEWEQPKGRADVAHAAQPVFID